MEAETVGVIYGVARWLVFAALALLIGSVAFVVLIWRDGARARRARALVWAGWTTLVAATVASFLLEGPYGAGLGLTAAWKPSLIGDVLDTHFGHVLVVRLVLLAIAFPLLRHLLRTPANDTTAAGLSTRWRASAAALAAGVILTVSLAGHADVGAFVPIAVVADAVHLSAMSLWVGGLVVLAVAALALCDLDELDRVVPRFSQLALGCVCALDRHRRLPDLATSRWPRSVQTHRLRPTPHHQARDLRAVAHRRRSQPIDHQLLLPPTRS